MTAPRSLFTPFTSASSGPEPVSLITRDQATALGHKLLDMGAYSVRIEHVIRAVTHIANGRIQMNDDGDELVVSVAPKWAQAFYALGVVTNQIDDAAYRNILARAAALTSRPDVVDDDVPDDTPEEFTFLPVSLWHDTTVTAMTDARATVVPRMIDAFNAANVVGSATVGLTARSVVYMSEKGLVAFARETDTECTSTVRTRDGTSSGWGGQAARDWTRIVPETVVAEAIDLAVRGSKPLALEPGRRTVILAPAAVAQLLRHLAPGFDAEKTDKGGTPLSKNTRGGNRLGRRIFDERIDMLSDPADPEGGFAPFFEAASNGQASSPPGYPVPRMLWIEHGVLRNLAYSISYGLTKGKPYCAPPFSFRLGGGTTTIEEMIAACAEGIYVNRVSNVESIDRGSGTVTGVTCDGCFLVKDGKIVRPIKNFRFMDSPFLFLNRVEAIGTPHRVALGNTPVSMSEFDNPGRFWPPMERVANWPRPPIIVPPMMIRDFNFTALADAV